HVLLIWNRLRCARTRRSARRDAKSDAVTSVERRNKVGARPRATPWGRGLLRRGFVEGLDRSPRYALRPAPARAAKSPRHRRFHMRRTCSRSICEPRLQAKPLGAPSQLGTLFASTFLAPSR